MPDWLESWAKPAIVGVALGAVIAAALMFTRGIGPVDVLTQLLVEHAFGDATQLVSKLNAAHAPEWLVRAIGFASGPGLPYTAGAALTVIVVPALRLKWAGHPLVEYLWPGPPDILDGRLEVAEANPTDPYAPGRPFLGREAEMQVLMRFAGPASGEGPAILALTGIEGMGKTRVALTWLGRLRVIGWDTGVLKRHASLLDIGRARFRRKTAIVVDEPSSSPVDLYELLDKLMTAAKGKRLRILVADQLVLPRMLGPREGELASELQLEPLAESTLRELAPGLSPQTLAAAEGRPLYALLGDDPARAIATRAHRRLAAAKRLGGEEAQRLLALAALAGPTANRNLRVIRHVDLSLLRRLFEGAPRNIVARLLPALKPARFADTVLLQYAEERTEEALHDLMAEAIAANPAAVEARLGSLWTITNLTGTKSEARAAMQTQFEKSEPTRVTAIRETAEACWNLIALEPPLGEDGRPNLKDFEPALDRLSIIVARRPFDSVIRLYESGTAVNAIGIYGRGGRWDDLERWGERLTDLVTTEPFCADPAIRRHEAVAAFNATKVYGQDGRWDDLERWGKRLMDLANTKPFRDDHTIRLHGAMTASNTVDYYGTAERWDDMERWGKRLTNLVATEPFCADPAIRRLEATAAPRSWRATGTV